MIDMEGHYQVTGWRGIAWYLVGYSLEWTEEQWEYLGDDDDPDAGADDYYERTGYYYPDENPANYLYSEPEQLENLQQVRAIMVGDDREFVIDIDDLTAISDGDYCHECGQIGCTALEGVYDNA